MKKSLLFLAITSFSLIASGQSFKVIDGQGNDMSNQTILLWGDTTYGLIKTYLKVRNTSASERSVKIKFVPNSLLSGASYNYCIPSGTCYTYTGPGPETSHASIAISSNDTTQNFVLDSYQKQVGASSVTYVFFDTSNPADSVYTTIVFNSTPTGIHDIELSANAIGNVFPNPSNLFATINYNLDGYHRNAKITLFDMLGNNLKNYELNGNSQGKVTINTSEMPAGMYFYSLRSLDGKTLTTKRLVINH